MKMDFNKSKYDLCKTYNLKTDKDVFRYVMDFWDGNEHKCNAWLKKYNVNPNSTETISYMQSSVSHSDKINESYQATKFILDNWDNTEINKSNEQKLFDFICNAVDDNTVKYESSEDRQARVNKQNGIVDRFNEMIANDKILEPSTKTNVNADLTKFVDKLNQEIKFEDRPQGHLFNNYKEV